jgi:hypothetical protein
VTGLACAVQVAAVERDQQREIHPALRHHCINYTTGQHPQL